MNFFCINEELWIRLYISFLEHIKVAELLIQKGADVNIIGEFDRTALIWAAKKGKQFVYHKH